MYLKLKIMTAIEYIEKQMLNQQRVLPQHLKKAKKMEKEQIKKSFIDGKFHELYGLNITEEERAETYYEETYT